MSVENSCKYHPTVNSVWFCRNCDTQFCANCVPEDLDNYLPKCTLCRNSLTSLSVAKNIPPFWSKLNQLLLLPLTSGSLGIIAIFAFVFASLPSNIFGKAFMVLALIPVVEFLLDSMERIASGDKLDQPLKKYLGASSKSFSLKLMLVLAFVSFVLLKLINFDPVIGWVVTSFFILGIPASLIILMMEKSIFAMINPIKIGFIIKQFGVAYFVLYAAMFALSVLAMQFISFDDVKDIGWLKSFLGFSLIFYLAILTCVMAGYLVFQYHHELNFTINRKALFQLENRPAKQGLVEVEIFIQEGRYEDAQKLLESKVKLNSADYRAFEKLILIYAVQNKQFLFSRTTNEYFVTMINMNKHNQATDFFKLLLERDIEFIPESTTVMVAIASSMKNKQHFKAALNLIDKFLERYSLASGWESLYLIKAQLMNEFANRSSEAKIELEFIIKRSIDQEYLENAEKYMIVNNMLN